MIRTALVNEATNTVDRVEIVPEGFTAPSGYSAVASDTANKGFVLSGGVLVDPTPPFVPKAADLIQYAQQKQIALRDGGITVNVGTSSAPQNVDVASDVNGRSLVTGCVQLVNLASQNKQAAPSFPWLNNDGTGVTLSTAQITTVAYALGTYVQATYSTLGSVLASIASGSITTTAAIDAAVWPVTAY